MTQKKINIALYQPDIPQNTAAIIRVAACLNFISLSPQALFLMKKKLIGFIWITLNIVKLNFSTQLKNFC